MASDEVPDVPNPRPPEPGGAFATTQWSVILAAREGAEPEAEAALARLCQAYWAPLYAFLRRSSHPPHDAEDLVQAFFARLFERDWLKTVDPRKGRFRSFLLASLRNFVSNEHRYERRKRRGGDQVRIHIDAPDEEQHWAGELALHESPERTFDRRWAETVVGAAMARLRAEFEKAGKGPLFGTLERWLATEARPGEYEAVGKPLGLSANAVSIAVHRLRQRYRELVRDEVAETVAEGEDVETEVRYLLSVLTEV